MRWPPIRDCGSKYDARGESAPVAAPPRFTPQCRHAPSQWSDVPSIRAKLSPLRTCSPTARSVRAGSNDDTRPPWSMLTTALPPTEPENRTTPSDGARITSPSAAFRSTPRWPASQGLSGGSYAAATCGRPSGQTQPPPHEDAAPPAARAPTALDGTPPMSSAIADRHPIHARQAARLAYLQRRRLLRYSQSLRLRADRSPENLPGQSPNVIVHPQSQAARSTAVHPA
ncbi:hypothetical protein F7D09_0561 [Bifidobacterium leontopitheci]|uniref:Uncharacterized protein n=1 Tax=Bifidobacterium leontopitheci TaxID=2650774 RepID=A0A6I1GHA8_9BIFI|nr:hypothetical protein F7D09_0561 [Bifidobacterium leontopitheci]